MTDALFHLNAGPNSSKLSRECLSSVNLTPSSLLHVDFFAFPATLNCTATMVPSCAQTVDLAILFLVEVAAT